MASPVTLVLIAVPPNLRHALTRWMIEPAPGVFVGTISAKVRDELWAQIESETHGGWALLVHTAQTEQGFAIRTTGADRRTVIDLDGLTLVTTNRGTSEVVNRVSAPQNS
jgi:CRISPR-associated protein Cas2